MIRIQLVALAALVVLTACPKPVSGSLAQTTFYLSDGVENAPSDGRAATVAYALPGFMREALKSRGYRLVTNPNLPHDLSGRLRVGLISEWISVTGSAHLIVEADGKVVDQIDVMLPSSGNVKLDAQQYSYWLADELADGLSESPLVNQFASGMRPAVPVKPAIAESPEPPSSAPGSFTLGAPQPNAWALIVGVEKYRDAPAASGARADAEAFNELARRSLGVPEEQIRTAYDDRASRGDLEKHLKWLATNVRRGDRIYLYFSGHGAPEPTTGTSYLLPYDGDPRALDETALKLSHVVNGLEATMSRDVLVMLDSCFSGSGGRSVLPEGARPLVPVAKAVSTAKVALFTASSGAEISGPAPGGTHGLFTATVLEGIGSGKADGDGDGQLSLHELAEWVRPRVARQAKKDLREQTPNLVLGEGADASTFVVTSGIR